MYSWFSQSLLCPELELPRFGGYLRAGYSSSEQKLNLALALLGDPRSLLLDEPYQGDHGTYVNFWDHVDAWRSEGKAILVVTHMLAELTRVDRVVELQRPSSARAA